jgi:hypothetical protein
MSMVWRSHWQRQKSQLAPILRQKKATTLTQNQAHVALCEAAPLLLQRLALNLSSSFKTTVTLL